MIGNIGQNATIKEAGGRKFIAFSVGTNESYTDAEGVKHENTTWVSCLKPIYNEQSQLAQFLTSGTQVYVRGKVSCRTWRQQNGEMVAGLNCRVEYLQLCSSKRTETPSNATKCGDVVTNTQNAVGTQQKPKEQPYTQQNMNMMPQDDGLPF